MTLEQCEQRNNSIMQAWREWKTGKNTLDNFDCAVLSEMFSIPYPKACQRYLEYTDSKDHARTEAPNKNILNTIFNFLNRLYNQEDKKSEQNTKNFLEQIKNN